MEVFQYIMNHGWKKNNHSSFIKQMLTELQWSKQYTYHYRCHFQKKRKNETAMPDDDWSAIKLAKHMNPSEKTGCTAWEMMKTMSDKDGDAQCKEQLELSPV